jgi:hypothetical protein
MAIPLSPLGSNLGAPLTAIGRYRPDQTLGLAKRSAVDQLLSVPQTTGTLGSFI